MEITGQVKAVLQPNQGVSQRSGQPWMSQEFVITLPGQYPRDVCFKIFGSDKIQQFAVRVGETVTVAFDIEAREHGGRWFNSLNAWNVTRAYQPQGAYQQQYVPQPQCDVPQPPQQGYAQPVPPSQAPQPTDAPF